MKRVVRGRCLELFGFVVCTGRVAPALWLVALGACAATASRLKSRPATASLEEGRAACERLRVSIASPVPIGCHPAEGRRFLGEGAGRRWLPSAQRATLRA